MNQNVSSPTLAELCLMTLANIIEERRAVLRRPLCITFHVVDDGHYVLDTSQPRMLSKANRKSPDTRVLCNTFALSELLLGRLGAPETKDKQTFVCQGDLAVFEELADCLESTTSLLHLRRSNQADLLRS